MARYLAGEMNMNEEIEFRDRLDSNKQQSELKQLEQAQVGSNIAKQASETARNMEGVA